MYRSIDSKMYSLATCVNTKWWVGYVTSIVPGILDSLLEPFWRFLDNFVLFSIIKKSSRRLQEAAETPSRRPKTWTRSDKTCQIVTKFLNIFANVLVFPNRLRIVKKYQEVPRSCSRSHQELRRSIKTPSSAYFLFKFVKVGQVP